MTFKTLHPTIGEYTSFSSVDRTSTKIDSLLSHRANLKFKKHSYYTLFSDYDGISLEINIRNILEKSSNIRKLNNTLNLQLLGPRRNEKGKLEIILNWIEIEKILKFVPTKICHQNNNLSFHIYATRERKINHKVSRRK